MAAKRKIPATKKKHILEFIQSCNFWHETFHLQLDFMRLVTLQNSGAEARKMECYLHSYSLK
jgi:hypothetical protein